MHSMIAHFEGTTVDMDRDLVVLVATEAGHHPQSLSHLRSSSSLTALG